MSKRGDLPAAAVFVALFLVGPFFCPAHAASASASVQVVVTQPQPVPAGTNFDYIINVSSEGPDDAANVQLTFPLPSGTSFQGAIAPAGRSCAVPAVGAGGTVTCTIALFPQLCCSCSPPHSWPCRCS
jgi:uncharacterized repeat protein (TIGR01451 family)